MPDDSNPYPQPSRDDRPPGGHLLRDAYEPFCSLNLWRLFEEECSNDDILPCAENLIGTAHGPAVYDEVWESIEDGTIIAFGHSNSIDHPAQEIPLGEWRWLDRNPIENGATFEGAGRCWRRVTFHWAANLPAEDTAPVARSNETASVTAAIREARRANGADGWGWLLSKDPELFRLLQDKDRMVARDSTGGEFPSPAWREAHPKVLHLLLSDLTAHAVDLRIRWRPPNSPVGRWYPVSCEDAIAALGSIRFWGLSALTSTIDGERREFRLFPPNAPALAVAPGARPRRSATEAIDTNASAQAEGAQKEPQRKPGQPNRGLEITDVFRTLNESGQFDTCQNRSAVSWLVWATVQNVVERETELPERLRGLKKFEDDKMKGLNKKTVAARVKVLVDADPDLRRKIDGDG